MSPNKIDNVIIADSQYFVVETVKRLVQENERYLLSGVVDSKDELLHLLGKIRNGLLIIDTNTIDYEGPDDLKLIQDACPQIKILVLTNFVSKTDFLTLIKSGVKNIVYKNIDKEELFSAIQATLKDKKYYSGEIIDLYLDMNENRFPVEESKNLTASEVEIVRMIADGLTTKEIANKKNISHHTVSTHRKNIFRKIGVSNASELIISAIKAGWIDNIEYYI
jgi:DNA-binding NarL/FixJ family response regulator